MPGRMPVLPRLSSDDMGGAAAAAARGVAIAVAKNFDNWDSLDKAANGQLVFTKNINGERCTLTATLGSKKHLVDGASKLRLVTFYTSLSQKTNFKKERKTRGARTFTGLTNVSPLREV